MTNTDTLRDILDSIAIETNSTDEFERLLACTTHHSDLESFRPLTLRDLEEIVHKTMHLGRYGAWVRNILRTYYSL